MATLRAQQSINVASRLIRVSGRFALTTQWLATFRYDGICASQKRRAFEFAFSAARAVASSPLGVPS
jgi:hypothetical protein